MMNSVRCAARPTRCGRGLRARPAGCFTSSATAPDFISGPPILPMPRAACPATTGADMCSWCLACAVLERSDPQITLRLLGEKLLALAADPALALHGFSFTLGAQHERRELVAVCRTLLELGVLQRVVGNEDAFVRDSGDDADALYNVQRRALAGMLATVRGPSTFAPEDAPVTLDARLHAIVDEHVSDSDEGRRTALRHQIARRLLDDPVVYADALESDARAYFVNQRGALAARLGEATGMTP